MQLHSKITANCSVLKDALVDGRDRFSLMDLRLSKKKTPRPIIDQLD